MNKTARSFIGQEKGEPFLARDGALIFELFRDTGISLKNMSIAVGYLAPGQKAIPHWHRFSEEIYYVISGTGKVRIDSITEEIKSGDAVYVPPGATHALENAKGEAMKIMAICSPPYEEGDMHFTE